MTLATAHLDDLPASARDLAGLIGLPATLRLVEKWGGTMRLYVPRNIGPDHELARVLGLEAARALSSRYDGDYLPSVPRCADALRAARDRALLRRRAEGASPAALALEFGLTERHVWRILSAVRAAGPQQALLPGLA